jgi:hypothetical protein
MEQLRSTFTSTDAAAAAVSGKFLQLIQHIVRDSSPQFHGLVSDIRQLLFALPHAQLHEEVAGTSPPANSLICPQGQCPMPNAAERGWLGCHR